MDGGISPYMSTVYSVSLLSQVADTAAVAQRSVTALTSADLIFGMRAAYVCLCVCRCMRREAECGKNLGKSSKEHFDIHLIVPEQDAASWDY